MSTNHSPHAVPDFAAVSGGEATTIDVLANDTDRDGDTLSLTGISKEPHHGHAEILYGSVLYTPDPGYRGVDHLGYLVDDGHGGTAQGLVGLLLTGPGHTFDSGPGNDFWIATPGPDTFNEHFSFFDYDPTHAVVDLGHDVILGFGHGDVIDYHDAGELNRQAFSHSSLDLMNSLDTDRNGILDANDGGNVKVHGHSITLDLGSTISGGGPPGPGNEVTFTGTVTVKGHTSLTAADLNTTAPWAPAPALEHVVHHGHEAPVG